MGQGGEKLGLPPVGLPQRLFRPLPLGDMRGRCRSGERACRPGRGRACLAPTQRWPPSGWLEPVLDEVVPAFLDGPGDRPHHATFPVVGVDVAQEGVESAREGAGFEAVHRLQAGRPRDPSSRYVIVPGTHPGRFLGQPESLLALPNRPLRPPPFGHVPEGDDDPGDLAIAIPDGGDAVVDRPADPSLATRSESFARPSTEPSRKTLATGMSILALRLLVDQAEHFLERTPSASAEVQPMEAFGDRVEGGDMTIGVGDEHAIADSVERGPESLALVEPPGSAPSAPRPPTRPRPSGPVVPSSMMTPRPTAKKSVRSRARGMVGDSVRRGEGRGK